MELTVRLSSTKESQPADSHREHVRRSIADTARAENGDAPCSRSQEASAPDRVDETRQREEDVPMSTVEDQQPATATATECMHGEVSLENRWAT